MEKFQKFAPEKLDKKVQPKEKLSDLEELIFRPCTRGIKTLTKKEFNEYINLNIEDLSKTKMNAKTVFIANVTKKFLIDNKEKVLNQIKEKEEEENER